MYFDEFFKVRFQNELKTLEYSMLIMFLWLNPFYPFHYLFSICFIHSIHCSK